MTDIVWGEPPPPSGQRGPNGVWVDRLAPFRERPNEWGRLPGEWSGGLITQLKRGDFIGIEAEDWEFRSRRIPDTSPIRTHIYARFVGVDR